MRRIVGIAVTAVLGILTTLYSAFVAYDLNQRGAFADKQLRLEQHPAYDPLMHYTMGGDAPFSVNFQFADKSVQYIRVSESTLSNTGKSPILASDFASPLTVSVREPWVLIAVSSKPWGDAGIAMNWKRVDERTMTADPTLINQGDSIYTSVYVAKEDGTQPTNNEWPAIEWSVRIPNMKSIDRSPDRYSQSFATSSLDIRVEHTGWAVPFMVVLAMLNQGLVLYQLSILRFLGNGARLVAFSLLASFISFCAAEAVTTYTFDEPMTVLTGVNHWLNLPIINAQALLLLALATLIWRRRNSTSANV